MSMWTFKYIGVCLCCECVRGIPSRLVVFTLWMYKGNPLATRLLWADMTNTTYTHWVSHRKKVPVTFLHFVRVSPNTLPKNEQVSTLYNSISKYTTKKWASHSKWRKVKGKRGQGVMRKVKEIEGWVLDHNKNQVAPTNCMSSSPKVFVQVPWLVIDYS
jgi:hypothetical protein